MRNDTNGPSKVFRKGRRILCMQQTCSKYRTLRGFGWLFVNDISAQNISSIFEGQAIEVPLTCWSHRVIAEGAVMRSRGGQTLFAAGEDDDLTTRTVHQVHINWVHPSTNCASKIYCPTPTKRVQLIKTRKQEVSFLTCATNTDDARGRYWKRKANRGGKKCVLSCRILNLGVVLTRWCWGN